MHRPLLLLGMLLTLVGIVLIALTFNSGPVWIGCLVSFAGASLMQWERTRRSGVAPPSGFRPLRLCMIGAAVAGLSLGGAAAALYVFGVSGFMPVVADAALVAMFVWAGLAVLYVAVSVGPRLRPRPPAS